MGKHGMTIDDRETRDPRRPARTYRVGELVRKPVIWFLGLVVATFGASLTALFGGVIGNWFDAAKVSDVFASGQPVTLAAAAEYASPWGWATPQPLSLTEVAAMPDKKAERTKQHDWIINHGGVNFIEDHVTLTLVGNRADPVQITNITPHLEHCGPPLQGSILLSHPPGGGNTNVVLDVNLDSPRPVFKGGADSGPNGVPFFEGHSITLKRNEVMTINITATSQNRTCQWDIAVEEVVDGHPTTQILGAANHWTVTGSTSEQRYGSFFGQTDWIDMAEGKPPNLDSGPLFVQLRPPAFRAFATKIQAMSFFRTAPSTTPGN